MRLVRKRKATLGQPPGTLIYTGEKKVEKVKITVIDYDEKQYSSEEVSTIKECLPYIKKPSVSWINIDGLHDLNIIEQIGDVFSIHPLILEDILNVEQHSKYEDLENSIFIVLKMIMYDEKQRQIDHEQVSIILGQGFVISFQEKEGDVFDTIRERIQKSKGRIRKMGADYLAYSLLDAIIDNYFIVLDRLGETIESLEDELRSNPSDQTSRKIHSLKREMIFLRKSIWPLREIINKLEREESSLIEASTDIFLKDLYDHTIQIIDTVETFRDMISGMLDTYLTIISNNMNSTMKVLTVIATIFIPLTFIAGIYGMNFQNMPELGWKWGYPIVWGIMFVIGILMLFFFKKKKWL